MSASSMKETLELLGMTREELGGRVVKQISNDLLRRYAQDEDGDTYSGSSEFHVALQKQIKEGIDAEVARLADKHVLPKVTEAIENVTLQETNKWGEATNKGPLTFIEYIVARAEAYMQEPVNHLGKSRSESGNGYSFKGEQNRLSSMISHTLHNRIESAVKAILANANESLVDGLQATIKAKLLEVAEGIKTTVKI